MSAKSDLQEVFIFAFESNGGWVVNNMPEKAWKKLSTTLTQHRRVVDLMALNVKAQSWASDELLDCEIQQWVADGGPQLVEAGQGDISQIEKTDHSRLGMERV